MSNQTVTRPSSGIEHMVEFNLLDVVRRVARGKYILLLTTILGAILSVVLALTTKPWYFAQAVFMPPKTTDISGSAGASLLMSGTDPGDAYLGLLSSRSIQDDVIDHLGLMQIEGVRSRTVARIKLAQNSYFVIGRNALIYVSIRSEDPQLAAKIANAYLDALYRLNSKMVQSSSDRRRLFFQQQLEEQRAALTKAQDALRKAQERTGVLLPGGEAQAELNQSVNLENQVEGAEARLAGLLVGETDQAPDVIAAKAQLAKLRSQLANQMSASKSGTRSGIIPGGNLPALTLDLSEKERDVKVADDAYSAMLQQYGRARMASIDPGPQLEIVDQAEPPEFKTGPDRRTYVTYGTVLGFFAGLLYLLFFEPLKNIIPGWRRANAQTR